MSGTTTVRTNRTLEDFETVTVASFFALSCLFAVDFVVALAVASTAVSVGEAGNAGGGLAWKMVDGVAIPTI